MNEEPLPAPPPLPPVPPIDDRRLILAIVEASEGLASLALGTLAANQGLRDDRMGRARISFLNATNRLNHLLGTVQPEPNEPQVIRPLEPGKTAP